MKKRIVAILIAALVAVGAMGMPATAANAGPKTGTVVVQLTTPSGHKLKLKDVVVAIYDPDPNYTKAHPFRSTAHTNSAGKATFKYIPKGLKLSGQLTPSRVSSALTKYVPLVEFSVGRIKVGKTVRKSPHLAVGATVSGQLTDTTGAVVPQAAVTLFAGIVRQTTLTNASGRYYFKGLDTKKYGVRFNAPRGTPALESGLSWSYWKNSVTYAGSDTIVVKRQSSKKKATSLYNINGVVAPIVSLTGNVYGPFTTRYDSNGEVLPPVGIVAVGVNGVDQNSVAVAQTSSEYSLGLVEGSYRIAVLVDTFSQSDPYLYWYTGDGNPLSTDSADAVPVDFAGTAGQTLQLGTPAG